jgi:pyruvate dehydrogenase E2 component (dihydrolipoamide acetyltransferase)
MAVDVTMPKLGLTMETGKIVEWKKQEGEQVQEKEILLVVETEKITYDVESPATGILHIISPVESEVPVADLIGLIAADKAEYDKVAAEGAPAAAATAAPSAPAAASPAPAAAQPSAGTPAAPIRAPGERIKASPQAKRLAKEKGLDLSLIPGTGPEGRITEKDVLAFEATAASAEKIKISPVAKKLAEERGLDISKIQGSGPGGRITKEDVERHVAAAKEVKAPAAQQAPAAAAPSAAPGEGDRLVKFTGMRRIIAQKMLQSKVQAAQAYMSNNVDASAIQSFRKQLLSYAEKKFGVRVTITDIMMKITACAIKEHPVINTRYTEEGDLWLQDIHMGMAMALKDGLIVPVIWNIDKKSIIEIAKDRVSLIDRGRSGKLTPDDMKGSTFTLSAMGMFGLEEFYAIINQPENAILAVGAIIDKPWVVDGQIVVRPIMNVGLTYDHRTVDGAKAGQFMQTLKTFIENPMMCLA